MEQNKSFTIILKSELVSKLKTLARFKKKTVNDFIKFLIEKEIDFYAWQSEKPP